MVKKNEMEQVLGVAVTRCMFCGGSSGLMINKHLSECNAKRVEDMHDTIVDMDPCPTCNDAMKKGIGVMAMSDASRDSVEKVIKRRNPTAPKQEQTEWMYDCIRTIQESRSGPFVVLAEDYAKNLMSACGMSEAEIEHVCRSRFVFMPDSTWRMAGLPYFKEGDEVVISVDCTGTMLTSKRKVPVPSGKPGKIVKLLGDYSDTISQFSHDLVLLVMNFDGDACSVITNLGSIDFARTKKCNEHLPHFSKDVFSACLRIYEEQRDAESSASGDADGISPDAQ